MFELKQGWTKVSFLEKLLTGNKNRKARPSDSGLCLYLTDDGNKCPVGCFIPDGHPAQRFLGGSQSLLLEYPDLEALMPLDGNGLTKLQSVHDEWPEYKGYNHPVLRFASSRNADKSFYLRFDDCNTLHEAFEKFTIFLVEEPR